MIFLAVCVAARIGWVDVKRLKSPIVLVSSVPRPLMHAHSHLLTRGQV